MPNLNREEFAAYVRACRGECGANVTLAIPLALRVLSDQLTPVLAYRRLVAPDATPHCTPSCAGASWL